MRPIVFERFEGETVMCVYPGKTVGGYSNNLNNYGAGILPAGEA
jgi:hypothetical protein